LTPARKYADVKTQVPEPYAHRPNDEDFYVAGDGGPSKPNAELLKNHFIHEGRVTESQALFILEQATNLLRSEPNMVHVKSPVTSASKFLHPRACIQLKPVSQSVAISTVNS
jgi:hypothetical protein